MTTMTDQHTKLAHDFAAVPALKPWERGSNTRLDIIWLLRKYPMGLTEQDVSTFSGHVPRDVHAALDALAIDGMLEPCGRGVNRLWMLPARILTHGVTR